MRDNEMGDTAEAHGAIILPSQGIGDVHEFGDVQVLPLENGDAVVSYEDGDARTGTRSRRSTTLGKIAEVARKPTATKARRLLTTAQRRLGRNGATPRRSQFFEEAKGATITQSSIGRRAILKGTELDSAQSTGYQLPTFDSVGTTFTASGGNLVVNMGDALRDILALDNTQANAGLTAPLVGFTVELTAPALNQVPGFKFAITTAFASYVPGFRATAAPAGMLVTNVVQLKSPPNVTVMSYRGIFAKMASGTPRFQAALVHIPATGSIIEPVVTLSGVPANYTAVLYFLQPTDELGRDFFFDADDIS